MLGLGLQYKTVEDLAEQFDLVPSQLLGLYNRMMRRILQVINGIMEQNVNNQMPVLQQTDGTELRPLTKSLDEELEQAAKVFNFRKLLFTIKGIKSSDCLSFSITHHNLSHFYC